MSIRVTWLGHGGWAVESGGRHILVDPFLDDCPTATVKSKDVPADYVLVSHGHYDHVADVAKIAKRTGATVVANFEICQWLAKQGAKHTEPMNLGGGIDLPCGRVVMTLAHHSSALPDGANGGNPCGFVLATGEQNLYFACDTGLFLDMRRIGEHVYRGRKGIDFAAIPIGDRYTMGIDDALEAVKLIQPKKVAPSHYNTWPPIAQDANLWAERVRAETQAAPVVVQPGEQFDVG